MSKQIHQFSLHEVMSGSVAEKSELPSTHVDEELLIQIKAFLSKKDNLLGFDTSQM